MNLFENLCIFRSLEMNRNVYSTVCPAPYSVLRAPCRVPNILMPSVRKRAHNARDWSPVLWASLGLEMAVAATYSINVLITFCCCFRPLLGDDIQKGLFVRLLFF